MLNIGKLGRVKFLDWIYTGLVSFACEWLQHCSEWCQ